jgi:prevent-host-death family protein
MRHVSVRELRNATAGVVDSVSSGETVVLTSNGREIAELRPLTPSRPRFVPASVLALAVGAPWSDDPDLLAVLADARDATLDDAADG